ncbi:hypothetical protein SLEP1_g34466 [Rubroshorea leprosula]|uniref:Uncharacterized protein n=1 Tax=Rubroshorea leprosula TaxID=152421 RepID=A0AAV5KK82_9ROSI|nr:hypothetical protein SLEP1_g34466 [Rubroshorea leprosula]
MKNLDFDTDKVLVKEFLSNFTDVNGEPKYMNIFVMKLGASKSQMQNKKKATIVPSSSDIKPIEAGWPLGNACKFLQLSCAAVMDILSRLPITTLLTYKCVYKRFLHLIFDPEFAQLHLTRSAVSIMIKTLPPVNGSKRLQVAQIEDNGAGFEVRKMEFTAKDSLPTCDFGHMNSCNGLICLVGFEKDDPIYVCIWLLRDD